MFRTHTNLLELVPPYPDAAPHAIDSRYFLRIYTITETEGSRAPATVDMSLMVSDGFALIHAFNAVVLSSSKPWGFIPEEDIHDTISHGASLSPDSEGNKEWTFRRIGNLTSWAAYVTHLMDMMPDP